MPLPEEVINRLSEDRPAAGGWSSGLLWFSGSLLVISLGLYAGITFVYKPYFESKLNTIADQLALASKDLTAEQATDLIGRYSQVAHVQSMLQQHVPLSQMFVWLSKNTAPNVYYSSFSFNSANQAITIAVLARAQSDITQQLAIFEASPDVSNVTISGISLANSGGYWQTTMNLVVKSSAFTVSK